MSSRNEKVQTVMAMCGVDEEFARSFLEANDWSVEKVCGVFFDGGAPPSGPPAAVAGATSSSSADATIAKIVSELGVSPEDARAIAAASGPALEDDSIRAPIAQTTGTLMEQSFLNPLGGGRTQTAFRNFEAEARRVEAERRKKAEGSLGISAAVYGTPNPIVQKPPVDDDEEFEYMDEDDEEENGGREKNLNSLFEPPHDLLFRGTFDQARAHAKSNRLWLLVNIQKDEEFFSYVLNRDLWRSDLASDIIQSNFVFFQRDFTDTESQQYIRYHKPDFFPHVAVIDPRTGERMLNMQLKTKATERDPKDLESMFLDKITNFLDSHTMDPQQRPSVAPKSQPTPTPTPPPEAPSSVGGQVLGAVEPTSTSASTLVEGTKIHFAPLEPEPARTDENATVVRIRLCDGKTVNRTILASQVVDQLFSFVHSLVPETELRQFDMIVGVPPKSLLECRSRTIEEEGLKRATISVRWV